MATSQDLKNGLSPEDSAIELGDVVDDDLDGHLEADCHTAKPAKATQLGRNVLAYDSEDEKDQITTKDLQTGVADLSITGDQRQPASLNRQADIKYASKPQDWLQALFPSLLQHEGQSKAQAAVEIAQRSMQFVQGELAENERAKQQLERDLERDLQSANERGDKLEMELSEAKSSISIKDQEIQELKHNREEYELRVAKIQQEKYELTTEREKLNSQTRILKIKLKSMQKDKTIEKMEHESVVAALTQAKADLQRERDESRADAEAAEQKQSEAEEKQKEAEEKQREAEQKRKEAEEAKKGAQAEVDLFIRFLDLIDKKQVQHKQ